MLRPQFPGRLLDQQDLAVDGVAHDVSSIGATVVLAFPKAMTAHQAIN
jgi:hypothetical protein